MSCQSHVMSCHVIMSCHVMSCHVMSRHVTSRHVTSRHVMPTGRTTHPLSRNGSCGRSLWGKGGGEALTAFSSNLKNLATRLGHTKPIVPFCLRRLVRYHLPSVANTSRTAPENRVRRRGIIPYSPPNGVLRRPQQDAEHLLGSRATQYSTSTSVWDTQEPGLLRPCGRCSRHKGCTLQRLHAKEGEGMKTDPSLPYQHRAVAHWGAEKTKDFFASRALVDIICRRSQITVREEGA